MTLLRARADSLRRGWWLVAACALLFGAVAFFSVWDRSDDARAEATLVAVPPARSATKPADLAKTVAPLVESRAMLENVIGNLRLKETPDQLAARVSTRTEEGRIVVAVDDPDPQRAVRVAQESALVFAQLVRERPVSATAAGASVTVFDPAHLVERERRDPLPIALAAGVGGAAIGLLAALLVYPPRRVPPLQMPLPELPPLPPLPPVPPADGSAGPDERLEALAARERALVERHADIASRGREVGAREQALGERGRELAEREHSLEDRVQALTQRELALVRRAAEVAASAKQAPAAPAPTPEPPAMPPAPAIDLPAPAPVEPPPAPAPAQPRPAPAGDGAFDLAQLERLVDQAAGAHAAERVEEWRYYLLFLRDHTGYDGRLPRSFDYLVEDVFAELLP